MRVLMVSLSVLALAACGPRQVEVKTGPEPTAEVALHVTNNLSQAVNVYVVSGANETSRRARSPNVVWSVSKKSSMVNVGRPRTPSTPVPARSAPP